MKRRYWSYPTLLANPTRVWAAVVLVGWFLLGVSSVSALPAIVVVEPVGQLEGPPGDPMSQPTDVVVQTSGTIWVLDGVNMRLARFSAQHRFERYVALEMEATSESVTPQQPTVAPIPPPMPEEFDIFSARPTRELLIPLPEKRGAVSPKKREAPASRRPVALGIDGDGRLLVGNREKSMIEILDPQGRRVATIPIPRDASERPADPTDVLAGSLEGGFWVVDNDNHCVKQVDGSGRLLRRIGRFGSGVGEFQYPATIARTADEHFLVVDVLNARVGIFDRTGQPTGTIGGRGVVAGRFFRPKGVACDGTNRVYVTDSFSGLVQAFELDGRLIGVWGTASGQIHRLRAPATICVGEAHLFYVVEMLANRVSVWRERGRP